MQKKKQSELIKELFEITNVTTKIKRLEDKMKEISQEVNLKRNKFSKAEKM